MIAPPIRIGLIGANSEKGWSAATHLPAIVALEEFELTAVATTRMESAQLCAERYGARRFYTDNSALARDTEVDLVVVSVKAPDHVAAVKSALDAGKHVLCEWPLGISLAEAETLLHLANQRQVRNFVGLQGHAASSVRYARAMIKEGFVGDILSATLYCTVTHFGAQTPAASRYSLDRRNGANLLSIIAGHALDMLCYLAGEMSSLSAIVANRRTTSRIVESGEVVPMTSPDQVLVNCCLASGAVASIHVQGGAVEPLRFSLEIHGTRGTLRLSSDAVPEIMPLRLEASAAYGTMLQPVTVPAQYDDLPAELGSGPAANVAHLYRAIARDLRRGGAEAPDFAHAVRRRRLLELIDRSSTAGRSEQC